MDNGEVIRGLNETWTFAGATVMEWSSGFVMFMMASELVGSAARSMPLLLIIMVSTSLSLAAARRSFPDEEVGLRNWLMVAFGLTPLNLPAPAILQPVWSGAPIKELPAECHFSALGLQEMFKVEEEEFDEVDLLFGGQDKPDENTKRAVNYE